VVEGFRNEGAMANREIDTSNLDTNIDLVPVSEARNMLELRGYVIRRFVFGEKFEIRRPDGSKYIARTESDFVAWALAEGGRTVEPTG
jgi:hypothetical protein